MTNSFNDQPYADKPVNQIYELLFCDNVELYQSSIEKGDAYPWNTLFDANASPVDLWEIINDESAESRVKLLAYLKLRDQGESIEEKYLLGVIVEVGLEDGLDVLASYKDGTARYLNHTGKMIIWEAKDEISDDITAQLFRDSAGIVNRIGPSATPRRPHPEKGMVRISFLVSDGLYFGEGPIDVLFNNALAAPALNSATALMNYLTNRVLINSN